MNLLFFINSLAGGGAERVVATLANFWAAQGWCVTVVTLAPCSADFYRLDARVARIAFDLAAPSRGVLDGLRQNLLRIVALRRVLRQVRPDVALAMMSTPSVLLACASAGMPHVCAIGSERCYPPHAPLGRIWGALSSKLYGRLAAVVALTSESARWIGAHSSARRVAVIPNAAVWPLPASAPMLSPHDYCGRGRLLLLAVGRLEAVKNFDGLLAAFAQLAARHPQWDLAILGAGPQRAMLAALIAQSGLTGRVVLPGLAGNVGDWYAHADAYVMTSRSEGFPNVLAEALAHGLPAVSVDCDTGPRDIIRHGVDGLLVPPDDPAALVAALDRMMGDSALRLQLAARARDARERFSVEKIAATWEALFADLRGRQARAPDPAPLRADRKLGA